MTSTPQRVRDLFLAAVRRPESEQNAYLNDACAGDDDLLLAARELLEAHAAAGSFLESPAPQLDVTRELLPVPERAGTVIGKYKLLEQLGEGGFGVVFLAEQTEPVRRKVAIKVLKAGMDTRQVVARFEAERQALAIMEHPNIARVYEGGTTAFGRPYFVMELVKGIPITEFCDQNHLALRQRLELFLSVCQAVQHAHQKGIIHRDLKPSNVLVSRHDTTPVVKVIDFGVAKALGQELTDKTLFTGVAQMIGTPLYMSPEQAGMSDLDVDTRSDIYALGVLLYELLTGTTPFTKERFEKAGHDEIRRIIQEEEPARPSTRVSTLGQAAATISESRKTDLEGLRRLCRGELDWIVMRCLEKDRNRRYETTSALAADVQRYLRDEPVQACPPSSWYRFRKLARRNRRALVMISVLGLSALAGVGALIASTVLVWKANKELKESVDRERLAVKGERYEAYFQRITVAHRELSTDNLAAAQRVLNECPELIRGWEWNFLMRLCRIDPLMIPVKTEVNGAVFSADGERLASAGGDGSIKVWSSRTGKLIKNLGKLHSDSVLSIAFHPDGKRLASRGADQWIKVWDIETGQEEFAKSCDEIRKFGTACTLAFSPNGKQLASGIDGTVMVWDWKTGSELHAFPGHEKNAISVAFSHDGRRLASACTGEGVKLWGLEAGGGAPRTIPAHRHPVSALAFSPLDDQLVTASLDRTVKRWDLTTGELLQTLVHTGNVECVAFSTDGWRLASAGEDKSVHIWDATTSREVEVLGLRGHLGKVGWVAFSPDGWRLASASADGTIRIWDSTPLRADEHQEVFTFNQHNDELRSIVVSPDGQRIASAGRGPLVKVWDAKTGDKCIDLNCRTNVIFALAWQPPNGDRIAWAGWDGQRHTVQIQDAGTGENKFPLGKQNLTIAYYAIAFSPDGRSMITGDGSGCVQVWDARTGDRVGTLGTHDKEIRGVVFSRDGLRLATASSDGEVKLWDAARLDKKSLDEKQVPRHILQVRVPGPSLNITFSPDGKQLVTGGEENTIKIWDAANGREIHSPLRGHSGEIYAVAFSHDGRWLASAGEDSTVKVWDCHNDYKFVRSFRGHTGLVCSLAFSPTSPRLYSGSRDHMVKVWDVSKLVDEPNR